MSACKQEALQPTPQPAHGSNLAVVEDKAGGSAEVIIWVTLQHLGASGETKTAKYG